MKPLNNCPDAQPKSLFVMRREGENAETFRRAAVTLLLLGMSVFFIVLGVTRNEQTTVLQKAVKICLECVGIG